MNNYTGPATLLLEDGRKFEAEADLAKDARGTWQGTLTFHGASVTSELANVDDGHLLVGARTGEFLRPNRSDWTSNGGKPFIMRIVGSDEAPF